MNLLSIIQEKVNAFSGTDYLEGLNVVINHIKVAESHLKRGQSEDDSFFTDVIYRTNQAFEGSLKEAYGALTGKSPDKKKPYEIERYLEEENLLKKRVSSLLSNYRTEWRNPSTHNHKLYFSEQEAFLAIVSIYAFFGILLDQMLEKIGYDKGKTLLAENKLELLEAKNQNLQLIDKVTNILMEFVTDIARRLPRQNTVRLYESEVLGLLSAYLSEIASDIIVEVNPAILVDKQTDMRADMRADMVLQQGDQKIVIELKIPTSLRRSTRSDGREQLFRYLSVLKANKGILLILAPELDKEMLSETITMSAGDFQAEIREIYPKGLG